MSESVDVNNMNSEGKKKIQDAIKQAAFCMNTIDGEREAINEIIARIHDEVGVDKKIFRKMVKAYHKNNFTEEVEEAEQFEQTYQSVMGAVDAG
jgi:ABC-type microcin C transport system permease subunit YejB